MAGEAAGEIRVGIDSGDGVGTSGTAAIVDIDGTLVDSNYQHALAWFRAFRHDCCAGGSRSGRA